MNTTTKISNTATASNGKQFQRTTKTDRFNFASIAFHIFDKRFYVKFCETEIEAIEYEKILKKAEAYESFEIVPVVKA